MRHKITVVGAGNVGATLAQRLAERDYADIVLVDIVEGLPQGKALDILEAGPVVGYDSLVTGTNGYEETAGSDVVVVTGGIARKPGMSRDDLVMTNAGIVGRGRPAGRGGVPRGRPDRRQQPPRRHGPGGPGGQRLPPPAGHRDGGRSSTPPASAPSSPRSWGRRCATSRPSSSAGTATPWFPLTQLTTVAGVPVAQLIAPERLEQIVQRTRDGGAEIVNLLKTAAPTTRRARRWPRWSTPSCSTPARSSPAASTSRASTASPGSSAASRPASGPAGLVEVIEVDLGASDTAALRRSAGHRRGDGRGHRAQPRPDRQPPSLAPRPPQPLTAAPARRRQQGRRREIAERAEAAVQAGERHAAVQPRRRLYRATRRAAAPAPA